MHTGYSLCLTVSLDINSTSFISNTRNHKTQDVEMDEHFEEMHRKGSQSYGCYNRHHYACDDESYYIKRAVCVKLFD